MDQSPVIDAPYNLTFQQVASLLSSDMERGLSGAEVRARLERYGSNELPEAPRINPFRLLASQFRSVFIVVLLVAAALNLVIWFHGHEGRMPYDTLVIMAIVLANAALGFSQDFKAEKIGRAHV